VCSWTLPSWLGWYLEGGWPPKQPMGPLRDGTVHAPRSGHRADAPGTLTNLGLLRRRELPQRGPTVSDFLTLLWPVKPVSCGTDRVQAHNAPRSHSVEVGQSVRIALPCGGRRQSDIEVHQRDRLSCRRGNVFHGKVGEERKELNLPLNGPQRSISSPCGLCCYSAGKSADTTCRSKQFGWKLSGERLLRK